jgi:tetratricopeptide (TPR) repeat protein
MMPPSTPLNTPQKNGKRPGALLLLFPALALVAGWLALRLLPDSFGETHLEVASTPPGATVFVNGRLAGATPLSLHGLKTGTYSIRLEKDGCVPAIRAVKLDDRAKIASVSETLSKIGVGALNVAIKQKGAEVLLDGELIGHTPLRRDDIPVGAHELQIRKTNCEPYEARVLIAEGQVLDYSGFPLEDKIRAMLQAAIEQDRQRVASHMDLAHYLFMNDELDLSAETYVRALQVASTPLAFEEGVDAAERQLRLRLRGEETNRLNEELKKKKNWPGKDVARFKTILDKQQETIAKRNPEDWQWVAEQANNFVQQDKLDQAQSLYLQHIAVAKGAGSLPQAYIQLMTVRLRLRNVETTRETVNKFFELYGNRPELLRQAGNAVYGAHHRFAGQQRMDVLLMGEKLLRRGAELTQRKADSEMNALCKFELAIVLNLQGRADAALPLFQESADGTKDPFTREIRSQRHAECLQSLGKFDEARQVLKILAASPRAEIANKARLDLKALDASQPSPENK